MKHFWHDQSTARARDGYRASNTSASVTKKSGSTCGIYLVIGKDVERLTIGKSNVVEFQEVYSTTPGMKYVLVKVTLTTTTVQPAGPISSPWRHDLQINPVTTLKISDFLDEKWLDRMKN